MQLTYDLAYNIAYIRFRQKNLDIKTIHLSDEINIDISSDGKLYGIELLNANEQLELTSCKPISIINNANSKEIEVAVP